MVRVHKHFNIVSSLSVQRRLICRKARGLIPRNDMRKEADHESQGVHAQGERL